MGFGEAISACFSQYATFTGRASRSEYWWFALFQFLAFAVAGLMGRAIGTNAVGTILEIVLLLPGLAVGVRRLHDIDRSGWWLLLGIIPLIGWIVLLIWHVTRGTPGPNRFGPDPLPSLVAAPA